MPLHVFLRPGFFSIILLLCLENETFSHFYDPVTKNLKDMRTSLKKSPLKSLVTYYTNLNLKWLLTSAGSAYKYTEK